MAKLNIFEKTEQPADPVKPRGVGMRISEWVRFDAIAKEVNMKPHALMLYVIHDFIRRYEAGEVPTENKKSLPGIK